jgi:hypothetical protein
MLSAPASFLGCRHRTTRRRKPDATDKQISQLNPDTMPTETIGPFMCLASATVCVEGNMVHVGLQQRERIELEELLRSQVITPKFLSDTVIPLNDESSSAPRLRLYNWCVSNYSKAHSIVTHRGDRVLDPVVSYNAMLKRLHRTLFDPYRRGTQLFFSDTEGKKHHTTVGQLLFIKWAHDSGIDVYVEAHETEIRAHLNDTTKRRATMGKQRVRELTRSSCKIARIVG